MIKKFIERPILSLVISVFIVLLGLISLFTLPVTQYPEIAPPAVSVVTNYKGANAEVCSKAVVTPLERAINGVPGMTYMTSVSGNDGMSIITIYFEVGTDPDLAAVNVQNRVATVLDELPEEVIKAGVKRVIKAVDLRVQRLQNRTIWLQNAQKTLENQLSKLKLGEIADWTEKQRDLYERYYRELWEVKSAITYIKRVRELVESQSLLEGCRAQRINAIRSRRRSKLFSPRRPASKTANGERHEWEGFKFHRSSRCCCCIR